MAQFDDMKLSVEALSGGKNTVLLDDMGMPSIMVRIPKFYLDEVITGAPHVPHPAFIVNGVEKSEIYISKFQNLVMNSRAYSLPFKDPAVYTTFDQALTYCKNKGTGWHLMTNAEWAAIALWCKKNNFMPSGNNNYGASTSAAYEKGKETYFDTGASKTGRVATGSGPVSWAHDNTNQGIFDLNGNVWEWVGGMRLNEGEIHVIKDNDAAINTVDQTVNSSLWQAIAAADGSLMAPGSAGTLKYDATGSLGAGGVKISTAVASKSDGTTSASQSFETIAVDAGITLPVIMKSLGLAPLDSSHGGDTLYMRNQGERLPFRGGSWYYGTSAGVFALNLSYPRSSSSYSIGFRSAFVL
ncbi:SUMF1/EgtB/PvdO family nonheme iron enzyme [Bacillota bacterium Lsc_1132]